MIEYMEGLLEEGHQEQEILTIAEELLRNRMNTPRQVLGIQTIMLRARATSGQYQSAIIPGLVAVRMAEELQEWDYFGTACLFLGSSYGVLGQYENACKYHLAYLQHLDRFQTAGVHEAPVWYNLGLSYAGLNKAAEASEAFEMAVLTSAHSKNSRRIHGVRQALVFQYLRANQYRNVPGLLAKCSCFLRHYTGLDSEKSRSFHAELRTKFALSTYRANRAGMLALRRLREGISDYRHMAALQMVLAQVALARGNDEDSLAHALSAKFCARRANRSDLENEATHFIYEATTSKEDSITEPQTKGLSI